MPKQSIKYFWSLATFKQGPQDAPYSPTLFGLVGFIYFLSVFLPLYTLPEDFYQMVQIEPLSDIALLAISLMATIGVIVGVTLVLAIKGATARLLQTSVALYGGYMAISVALYIVSTVTIVLPILQAILPLVYLTYLFWMVSLTVHVYKHALDISKHAAVALTLAFGFLQFILLTIVMGMFVEVIEPLPGQEAEREQPSQSIQSIESTPSTGLEAPYEQM